ncbi:ARPP-1 family domain-containing protein [Pyxidicoccus sp. 3LG]
MKSRLPLLLALLAAPLTLAQGNPNPTAAPELDLGDYEAGAPVLAYNLAVVPLHTRKAPPYDDYTVLEEAQAAKKVSIRELDDNGTVRELRVHNRDERPLYLVGGELLLGGKQDRMVQNDVVLDPGERQKVPVFCVEQGRWNGQSLAFQPALAVAHPDLRRAALFSEQGAVWGEVARKSEVSGVSSPTGTYRRVFQDAGLRERIGRYLDEIQKQLPRDERMAGLAVAINGELEVVDVFDSPKLYSKLERKLLASYVLAALEKQPGQEKDAEQGRARARALKKGHIDEFVGGTGPATKGGAEKKIFRARGKAVHGTYFGAKKKQEKSEPPLTIPLGNRRPPEQQRR